jgi:hypothetical protein
MSSRELFLHVGEDQPLPSGGTIPPDGIEVSKPFDNILQRDSLERQASGNRHVCDIYRIGPMPYFAGVPRCCRSIIETSKVALLVS